MRPYLGARGGVEGTMLQARRSRDGDDEVIFKFT
jgi:hypothetical protein